MGRIREAIAAGAFPLPVGFWLLLGDDDGGVYLVAWGSGAEELDDLAAAAGGGDGFSFDVDDLAELANDHELASLVDER